MLTVAGKKQPVNRARAGAVSSFLVLHADVQAGGGAGREEGV